MLFEEWWHNIGSGILPTPDDDIESHAKKVAKQAYEFSDVIEKDSIFLVEFIEHLQEIQKSRGNLPVYVFNDGIECSLDEIAVEEPENDLDKRILLCG